MVTQENVNRFLDMNVYLAPSRNDNRREQDLLLRFDEADASAMARMFRTWQKRGPRPPLPVVQQELAQNFRLCSQCNAVLDFSKQRCVGCGHLYCKF